MESGRKSRTLVLVDTLSGLTAAKVVAALNANAIVVLDTDGGVPLSAAVRVIEVPEGADVLDGLYREGVVPCQRS